MEPRFARHPATWIAVLALLVAGGGTGYAAAQLTGKDIKNGSLTGKDVKDGSLSAKDADNSLEGPPGPKGAPGSAGPSGPAGPGSTFTTVTLPGTSAAGVMEYENVANCPIGATVVSAGYVVTPSQSGLRVVRSYAIDADSWLVRAESPTPAQISITIVAICVS